MNNLYIFLGIATVIILVISFLYIIDKIRKKTYSMICKKTNDKLEHTDILYDIYIHTDFRIHKENRTIEELKGYLGDDYSWHECPPEKQAAIKQAIEQGILFIREY